VPPLAGSEQAAQKRGSGGVQTVGVGAASGNNVLEALRAIG
jgi:hypothetical protein